MRVYRKPDAENSIAGDIDYQRPHGTNRSGHHEKANSATESESGPKFQRAANRVNAANKSCQNRNLISAKGHTSLLLSLPRSPPIRYRPAADEGKKAGTDQNQHDPMVQVVTGRPWTCSNGKGGGAQQDSAKSDTVTGESNAVVDRLLVRDPRGTPQQGKPA
jgi:hypothetical protein